MLGTEEMRVGSQGAHTDKWMAGLARELAAEFAGRQIFQGGRSTCWLTGCGVAACQWKQGTDEVCRHSSGYCSKGRERRDLTKDFEVFFFFFPLEMG